MNKIGWFVVDGCGVVTVVTGASVVSATGRHFSLVGEGGKLPDQPTESIIGRLFNSRKDSWAGNTIAQLGPGPKVFREFLRVEGTTTQKPRKVVIAHTNPLLPTGSICLQAAYYLVKQRKLAPERESGPLLVGYEKTRK